MKSLLKKIYLFFYWKYYNYKYKTKIYNYKISPKKIKLGKRVMIRKGTEISGYVIIGDYSYISGPNTYVKDARIGKHTSIARNVIIGVEGHDYNWVTTGAILSSKEYGFIEKDKHAIQKAPPIIGNDVWIGVNCIIMRGIRIGDGAVIAAGSVVTKDVEPYSIVGGVPARKIKLRFEPKVVNDLKKIKWWDWPDAKIKRKINDFYNIVNFININKKKDNNDNN